MSVIFAHLNFFFSGALSKFGPSAYNTGLPGFLLFYCLFSYYYGYWKDSLVYFAGFPYVILAGLLIYFRPSPPPRKPATAISIAPLSIKSDKELNKILTPLKPTNQTDTSQLRLSKEH
jgi:hypothetical protein